MNALTELEPDPLEIDPNPCEHCGLTIDRHRRVDTDEGAEFFCWDDSVVKLWELADCRDRWRHTGEKPPSDAVRNSIEEWPPKRPYRTADSTVAAFWLVVGLNDPKRLKSWMRDHPHDAPTLLKLLEGE
jgi:hypothetical protein